MARCRSALIRGLAVLLIFCFRPPLGNSYSVLTHEEVVDLLWKDQLQPLLLERFPQATPDELREAHAYAYGGSLIQDMGYYPFGNKYFSDLLHYVRSGDFVLALIQQSSNLNEYAFSLGALAHYSADNCGHPTINRVMAIDFPRLRRKYGREVTYEDDPKDHIRVEFGFDMVQVAKNRYTPDSYHDFIGFQVSKPVLERAFQQTYGMPLHDVIRNEDLAIGTFRRAVSKVVPEMTRVALLSRRKELVHDTPNFSKREFLYHLSRKTYEKDWGTEYHRPGTGVRVLAFFLRIVPKVGPFKALAFKIPTTQTEDMYIKSIDTTVDNYDSLLRAEKSEKLELINLDFDTGRPAKAGEYALADQTYARLLDDLNKGNLAQVSPNLQQNILSFYAAPHPVLANKKEREAWQKTQSELDKLKVTTVNQALTAAVSTQ